MSTVIIVAFASVKMAYYNPFIITIMIIITLKGIIIIMIVVNNTLTHVSDYLQVGFRSSMDHHVIIVTKMIGSTTGSVGGHFRGWDMSDVSNGINSNSS